jgi:hypothetical protein
MKNTARTGALSAGDRAVKTDITERRLGRMMISYAVDRFATQVDIGGGDGIDCLLIYCDVAETVRI